MNPRKEQRRLLELFCELVAPYVRLGAEQTLRAYLTHKDGRKFDMFICHGDLNKLFALREVRCVIPVETPCIYGIHNREQTSWSEAERGFGWDDCGLALALDGSWMAIKQELTEMKIYVPIEK